MRALLLALLLLPAVAAGQREGDIQALRALIAQRNTEALHAATRSWKFDGARELPPALEALIVEHFADPAARRPLLGFIARDLERFERYPKYGTRPLFDLLYGELKAGRDTHHHAIKIIATTLPVEAELTALLAQLDPAAANEIVMFVGQRKYAPAVAALQALQARIPHERNTNGMIERVDWAYLQIGTPQASAALLARLRALAAMRSEAAGWEISHILRDASQVSNPPYKDLAAALPAELDDNLWSALIDLVARRREQAGIPDLVRAAGRSRKADEAVRAVLAIGQAEDWRAVRAALAQSPLPREQVAPLERRLDTALADTGRFVANREREENERRLGEEKRRIAALRTTDPRRYAAEMRALLEKAPPGPALAQDYLSLAAFQRFTLRQPDDAIASYQAASRLREPGSLDLAAAAAADVYRFDKRDSRKAVEHYRSALGSYRPAPQSRDAALYGAFRTWLEREVAYLESGRRFSGTVGPADMQMAYFWLAMAAMHAAPQTPADPDALDRLPASQYQLGRGYPAMLSLAPREMLAFFERHDPAGYLTASVLAFALYKEPSPYVKAAADTFFRARGIKSALSAPGDARFASPEKTWNAFIAASKKGDAAGMLQCFTLGMQARMEPFLRQLSAAQLREMGASFVGFSMADDSGGTVRDATVVRQTKERRAAGMVSFLNEGGSWKIDSM